MKHGFLCGSLIKDESISLDKINKEELQEFICLIMENGCDGVTDPTDTTPDYQPTNEYKCIGTLRWRKFENVNSNYTGSEQIKWERYPQGDSLCAPIDDNPDWRPTSTFGCSSSSSTYVPSSEGRYRFRKYRDFNFPNSTSTQEYEWRRYQQGDSDCADTSPQWVSTGVTNCSTSSSTNTGSGGSFAFRQEKDSNPNSSSYNETRWVRNPQEDYLCNSSDTNPNWQKTGVKKCSSNQTSFVEDTNGEYCFEEYKDINSDSNSYGDKEMRYNANNPCNCNGVTIDAPVVDRIEAECKDPEKTGEYTEVLLTAYVTGTIDNVSPSTWNEKEEGVYTKTATGNNTHTITVTNEGGSDSKSYTISCIGQDSGNYPDLVVGDIGGTDENPTVNPTGGDGTYTYLWEVVSGCYVIDNPTTETPTIRCVEGQYCSTGVIKVTVTSGEETNSTTKTVNIECEYPEYVIIETVTPNSQTIFLPTDSVTLTTQINSSDGYTVVWTKRSGGSANIETSNADNTDITGLSEGTYVFRITATGTNGTVAYRDFTVIVKQKFLFKRYILPVNGCYDYDSQLSSTNFIEVYSDSSVIGAGTELYADSTGTQPYDTINNFIQVSEFDTQIAGCRSEYGESTEYNVFTSTFTTDSNGVVSEHDCGCEGL